MIGNTIQFNRRSVVSLLLAVVLLTLAVAPALAWFDEGEVNGQPAQACRVITDNTGEATVSCSQVTPHYAQPVAEQSLLRPAIAKAEQMFMPGLEATELAVQSSLGQ